VGDEDVVIGVREADDPSARNSLFEDLQLALLERVGGVGDRRRAVSTTRRGSIPRRTRRAVVVRQRLGDDIPPPGSVT